MKAVMVTLAPEGVIRGILDAEGDQLEGVNMEFMSIERERGKRQLAVKHRTNTNVLVEFRMPFARRQSIERHPLEKQRIETAGTDGCGD